MKFVNFGTEKLNINNVQSSTIADLYDRLFAIEVSVNKIFIAYTEKNNKQLYGLVCSINNNEIIIGTVTNLSANNYSGNRFSIVKLSENKVFITHSIGNYNLYGMICTISNNEVTVVVDAKLSEKYIDSSETNTVRLNDSKVLLLYAVNSTYNVSEDKLYGMVCTINNNEISVGAEIQLSALNSSGSTASAVPLNENKVFIAHGNFPSSGRISLLYGMVCTISNNEITVVADTMLSSVNRTGAVISATKISNNKVFIAHSSDNPNGCNNYLNGLVCLINSNNEIQIGNDKKISTIYYSACRISAIKISENKIFIGHCGSSSSSSNEFVLYGLICVINELEILKIEEEVQISDEQTGIIISAIRLSNNKIFIGHNANLNFYATIYETLEETIDKTQSVSDTILGIAKTKGNEGQVVKVIVPN